MYIFIGNIMINFNEIIRLIPWRNFKFMNGMKIPKPIGRCLFKLYSKVLKLWINFFFYNRDD